MNFLFTSRWKSGTSILNLDVVREMSVKIRIGMHSCPFAARTCVHVNLGIERYIFRLAVAQITDPVACSNIETVLGSLTFRPKLRA